MKQEINLNKDLYWFKKNYIFIRRCNESIINFFEWAIHRGRILHSEYYKKKMTIFANESDISNHRLTKPSGSNTYVKQTEPNKELINLIVSYVFNEVIKTFKSYFIMVFCYKICYRRIN